MQQKNPGKSIHIFLADGNPEGIRVITRPGWTGSLLAFPRPTYQIARTRPESKMTGVYLLLGPNGTGALSYSAYIGEGDIVSTRLDNHHRDKDFWTHGYVLTSQNNFLNKAHVRYLEARLIQIALKAGNVTVTNNAKPDPIRLSEADESDMEAFLGETLPLFPLMGVHVFDTAITDIRTSSLSLPKIHTAQSSPGTKSIKGDSSGQNFTSTPISSQPLYLRGNDVYAEGRDDPRGFIVLAGSLARRQKLEMGGYRTLRNDLERKEILTGHSSEQLELTSTYIFASPSAAATVMTGSSRNGRKEWKSIDGLSLSQIQQNGLAAIQNPSDNMSSDNHISDPQINSQIHKINKQNKSTKIAKSDSHDQASSKAKFKYDEDLLLLLRLGYLQAGEKLTHREVRKGLTHIATIESDGALKFNGKRYGAPSTPLTEVTGGQRNGWKDWRLADGRRLDALRKKARKDLKLRPEH